MVGSSLGLYSVLSRLRLLRSSYQGKIMLVAFVGTHVPLLTLLCYFVISTSSTTSMMLRILGIALLATLAGTATTLVALHNLLKPIIVTSQQLRHYLRTNHVPALPTHFADEVGALMADTQQTVEQLHETITHTATYDQLTGLPNRAAFQDRLQQALRQNQREGKTLGVVLLDINGFKAINNGWGHATGDLLLKAVVLRLRGSVQGGDVLARLGGDEFAVLYADGVTMDQLAVRAQYLLDTFARPFVVDGQEFYLSISIGITSAPMDGESAEQLLRNADAAMGLAQQQGQSSYQFYAADFNKTLQQRLALENDLRNALAHHEFRIFYQPQIDLQTGHIVGVEALLRWQHPRRGLVSPAEFIPIAEVTGLIVPIGEWVLREACRQGQAWREAGLPPLTMAVNLSARQCRQSDLVEMIGRVLAETGFDPGCLQLEVTESAVMENMQQTTRLLQEIRAMGVAVALDDFGTGYSSLNYLQSFPITTLKIDRSFVQAIVPGNDKGAIADAVIALAHGLKLDVLAEGVETTAQREHLRAAGCDKSQGFLFSRPLPADQLLQFLEQHEGIAA